MILRLKQVSIPYVHDVHNWLWLTILLFLVALFIVIVILDKLTSNKKEAKKDTKSKHNRK
jgi:hypothetical protein